jgi:prepilin-type N-terminal cleavage/methylation domain-containing protein
MARRGFTLIEIMIAIGLIGLMSAMAYPRIRDALTKQAARSGRAAVIAMQAKARATAIQRGRAAQLVISGNSVLIVSKKPVTGAVDTVGSVENLNSRFGVTLVTTRDTLKFDPRGLGIDAGDSEIRVSKGAYTYAVTFSQYGRIIQ